MSGVTRQPTAAFQTRLCHHPGSRNGLNSRTDCLLRQIVEEVPAQADRLHDCAVLDRTPLHPASRFRQRRMNPDKLFDYLDGRLSTAERAALEEQSISDRQLERALAVARHSQLGMQGDSREVLLPAEVDVSARGRKMALRVGAAFIVLMGVNVGIGLWLIARHETKNPNRTLLEAQMRQQISKALEHAATALTPAPLGVSEITVPVATGKLADIADQVATIATRVGGSATKGLGDQHRLSVVVDIPPNRESEFRTAIVSIAGEKRASSASTATQTAPPITPEPGSTIAATVGKKSFVVQIVEPASKQD